MKLCPGGQLNCPFSSELRQENRICKAIYTLMCCLVVLLWLGLCCHIFRENPFFISCSSSLFPSLTFSSHIPVKIQHISEIRQLNVKRNISLGSSEWTYSSWRDTNTVVCWGRGGDKYNLMWGQRYLSGGTNIW